MLYDLDAFYPVRPGSSCALYGALYKRFDNVKFHDELGRLVTVACRTVDWVASDWAAMFAWGDPRGMDELLEPLLVHYEREPAVQAAIVANSASVTREDGLDWLRVMLKRKPWYWGRVPVWTRRALRELRHEQGWKNADLARAMGLVDKLDRMNRWAADTR
jgi:hypothetical protein